MQTAPWRERAADTPEGASYVTPEPAPSGAKLWFFTRKGGVSEAPYDTLNVSTLVGDEPSSVEVNRARIRTTMDGRSSAWVRQVAGDGVVRVGEGRFAGEGDALVTAGQGFALAVAIADCVPVALVGEGVVGMVHSGWRGTLKGISGKAAREMGDPSSIRAYIGPGIRGCCYEVSAEIAGQFAKRFGREVVDGRMLSLAGAIQTDLREVGVKEVHDLGLCTGCRTNLFYSHRKEGPKTGRNLAAVALDPGSDSRRDER